MVNQFTCSECGNNAFLINGWEVTEETLEREDIEDVYDKSDLNKIDIVEIICNNCNEPHMTVTGGEI